jgi:predicted metalloprotease with PDZ domain
MIRDFARNIVTLKAMSNGVDIFTEKLDKQTWKCEPCEASLVVTYDVYAWDLSVRSAHLDTTHGYFNGTSVFLMVHGKEWDASSVEILAPKGEKYKDWRVSTAMARNGAKLYGFGKYCAKNYDELVDHPVELGNFSLATFEVAGVPHDIVLTGKHDADLDRVCQDVKTLCEHHVELFGELPEMERYVFQVMVVGEGYGGLEHRASTSLLCSRYDLPCKGEAKVNERYRNFLGLCSHEYFHTWNVKRIKPAVFLPYELNDETYTRLLWVFEGFTSYYDDLSLVRTGLVEPEEYLDVLAQTITRVLRGSGRLKQSVSDSSFDAWSKFYKQDENAPNAIVSYYAKGSMIALALDLHIRQETNLKFTLDDVMRKLWVEFGKVSIGVDEKDIECLIEEWVGLDLGKFFELYLYGTRDIPLDKYFSEIGLKYILRPTRSLSDKGGRLANNNANQAERVDLGVRIAPDPVGVKVTHVFDDGAAQKAGVAANDTLIALDGIQVNNGVLEERLARYNAGDYVAIHLFRRDELMELNVCLQAAPLDTCEIHLPDDKKLQKQALRWLKG